MNNNIYSDHTFTITDKADLAYIISEDDQSVLPCDERTFRLPEGVAFNGKLETTQGGAVAVMNANGVVIFATIKADAYTACRAACYHVSKILRDCAKAATK